MRSVICSALMVVAASAHAEEVPEVQGWRRDGRGLYPEATPPLSWSREAVDSVVKTLRCQVDKPKGDAVGGAVAIPRGDIPRWLGIGPFPAEGDGDLNRDYLDGESAVAPSTDDEAGGLAWKALTPSRDESKNIVHTRYDPAYELMARADRRVGYLHVHIHAGTGGPAVLQIMHPGGLKAYLNGEEVYRSTEPAGRYFAGSPRYQDHRRYEGPGPTPRVRIAVRKGWNRLLLKSLYIYERRGRKVIVRLADREDIEYKAENIRWATRLPDWGVSSPIVVGEKIFLNCEPDILVCLDKGTGKLLWTRSTTIHGSITPGEREKHPELKDIDPLANELNDPETDYHKKVALRKEIQAILDKVDKLNYAWPYSKCGAATGFTFPTPVSDGEHVYVFYRTSIAACYDMEGNRKWIRNLIKELTFVPSGKGRTNAQFNVSAPLLVDDKLILLRNYLAALNKRTGELIWKAPELHGHHVDAAHDREELKTRYNANFSATPAVCTIGGEQVIVCGLAAVVRLSDGKLLVTGDRKRAGNPRAGFAWDGKNHVWFGAKALKFGGSAETATIVSANAYNLPSRVKYPRITGHPTVRPTYAYAPSLVHNGLVYSISLGGVLAVYDAKTLKAVFQGLLDLEPQWSCPWSHGCCAGPTLGGEHILLMDNQLNTVAIKPGRQFIQVARNSIDNFLPRFGPESWQDSPMTNPVFDRDCIYIRGEKDLFCIGLDP